jgi:serine/threonine-protein kinase
VATSRIADQVGRVLGGRYRLLAPIGTGASAHVYSADDVVLRRRVAVKVLHAELADDESFLRRFRAEAQAVATLRHPNIMNVYDSGEDGGSPYLVLELLGGGSLRAMLDRGHRLTPSQALLIGMDAAKALDYAHRRGLVHRDIKPANLLFDEEGRLCIADFGLARALAEATVTEPIGAMLGTARYASPEQARGSSVDGKADIYALALVLIEAVTGQVPFAADTTIGTLMARLDNPLVAPPEMGPLGPPLEQAGRSKPSDRPDAAGLVQAFDRAARALPAPTPLPLAGTHAIDDTTVIADLTAHPTRSEPQVVRREAPPLPTSVVIERDPTVVFDADDVEEFPVRRRRRRWPWLVALVLVLALGGGAAGYAMVQSRVPTHLVPTVTALTLDKANAQLAPEKFKLHQSGDRYDEDAPAGVILEQHPAPNTKLKEGQTVEVVVSKGPQPRTVPDLSNMTFDQASQLLTSKGLLVKKQGVNSEDIDKDKVVDWDHKGETLDRGATITITVSLGPVQRTISDWRGKPFDATLQKAFADARLNIQRNDVFDDTIPAGQVVSTNPPAGSKVDRDSTVTVNVSKGPDLVTVPDVTGKNVDDAQTILAQAGLSVANVFGPPNKRVFTTIPQPGTKVKRGSSVNLYTA